MLKGSCLCGGVSYKISEPLENFTHCHCSMCRKVHGAMFGSYLRTRQVEFTEGKDLVVNYESSPGFERCFCGQCGSVLPEQVEGAEYNFVAAGGLDDDVSIRPEKHIFASSQADWHQITDDLPQLDSYGADLPYEAGLVTVEQEDRSNRHEDHVGGSCLCGDVTFRFAKGSAKLMMQCHCTRCRKVKGAAHASNVFVAPEDFDWLEGKDQVVVYDLPEAERFGNSFCKRCGSSVPRQASNAPMINVPAGSLDDDPGIKPKANIYVGSKANWFEVTDRVPEHDEMPAS